MKNIFLAFHNWMITDRFGNVPEHPVSGNLTLGLWQLQLFGIFFAAIVVFVYVALAAQGVIPWFF